MAAHEGDTDVARRCTGPYLLPIHRLRLPLQPAVRCVFHSEHHSKTKNVYDSYMDELLNGYAASASAYARRSSGIEVAFPDAAHSQRVLGSARSCQKSLAGMRTRTGWIFGSQDSEHDKRASFASLALVSPLSHVGRHSATSCELPIHRYIR
jgi:hypothetical protein